MIKKYLLFFLRGWKIFYENINFFVSFILLSLVYFFGVGLSFVIVKIFRIRLFDFEKNNNSYWTVHETKENDFYKQF